MLHLTTHLHAVASTGYVPSSGISILISSVVMIMFVTFGIALGVLVMRRAFGKRPGR